MTIDVRPLAPDEISERLADLARLRITVFREWPYLYDGDAEYERRYLQPYTESDKAVVVGAFEGARLVGASTGMPLSDHDEGISQALIRLDIATGDVFYLAESVLLSDFHGRGIGHRFFDQREAHAIRHGFRKAAFASVIRPRDHPERPPSPRDLTPFWSKRGYSPVEGATAHLSWRDVGQSNETEKELAIWMRHLDAASS